MSATPKSGAAIPTLVTVDPTKPAHEQVGIHNRWHPDIPSFVKVAPGQAFKIECHEWTGGQIMNNDSADDIHNVDLTRVHNLSGPVEVEGAEPGDILEVDILDVQPFPSQPWGFTGIFDLHNGGGLFAREFDSKAGKAIWDFEGIYATSRHIPGVKFAGVSHPGLIGCAPDAALLAKWNAREKALVDKFDAEAKAKGEDEVVPAVAQLPQSKGAHIGVKEEQKLSDDLLDKIKSEGARTIPPREHGGNVDIKNLSRGSKVFFPVYVKGAKLSVGDLHFSQGDGELSFCGAIEMAGIITLKTSIIKGGVAKFGQTMPMFSPSPIDPLYSSRIIFQGISVDMRAKDGSYITHDPSSTAANIDVSTQHSMDATVAYKQAALNAIEYLMRLGYSRDQAYLLLSAAPVDSHVAGLVDVPNACVTLGLPTGIFDFDIMPKQDGLHVHELGQSAMTKLPRAR